MILLGILSNRKISAFIILASFTALLIFLLSLGGIIPSSYFGLRLDLILFTTLTLVALTSYQMGKK
jgi:hypothetical protein